jgi:hypothetical protein
MRPHVGRIGTPSSPRKGVYFIFLVTYNLTGRTGFAVAWRRLDAQCMDRILHARTARVAALRHASV